MTNTITLDPWSYRYVLSLWETEEVLTDAIDTIGAEKGMRLLDASSVHMLAGLSELIGEELAELVLQRTADGYTLPAALHECGVRVPGVDLPTA